MISGIHKIAVFEFLTPPRAAVILVIVPIIAFASNFAFNDRSRHFIAHDYVDNIFKSMEPRGMLLTSDWQMYSPSLYVREIEGRRKDTIVLDVNLLRRSWYFGYLDQVYPQMTEISRGKIDSFLEDLRAWDRDPESYEKSATLNQRINSRFHEMLFALVTNQLNANGPVYLTRELADPKGGQDLGLTRALGEKYELVPQGLVFRVIDKTAAPNFSQPQILTRGLNDGTLKFDEDDVVRRSVIPTYLNMLLNDGLFLASRGEQGRAIECFRQALTINPSFEPAKNALAASKNDLQKTLLK